MKSYRDLDIYNLSYRLAIKVHRMSLGLPKYEMYEEGSQIRRSSKGITSCIVEGYGRRRYKADLVKYLVYAHASCDETVLHLNFLNDTHELEEDLITTLLKGYDELGRKFTGFSNTLKIAGSRSFEKNLQPATSNVQPVTRNRPHTGLGTNTTWFC